MTTLQDAKTKLLPSNMDAERAVLCSILIGLGETLDLVLPVLGADDFYLDDHRVIYVAMQAVHASGRPVGLEFIVDELKRRPDDRDEGYWLNLLMQIMDSVPHEAHAVYHAERVKSASIQRNVICIAGEMIRKGYQQNTDTDELLHFVDSEVSKLLELGTTIQSKTFKALTLSAMDRLTSAREEGIRLGFTELDDMLFGAKPGQVIVLAARPGVGKSALAANIARYVAKFQGVLFCSIEMPEDELMDRAIVSDLGISLGELRPMARDDNEREKVLEVLHTLSGLPITIDESGDQSLSSIAAQARLARRKHGLGLIIVDYLQIIRPENKKDSREQQVSAISWGLKRIAKKLGVPIIALAQLNRDIEKRADKTPQLSDLRESGAIEQNANVVLMLDRPHTWDEARGDDEAIIYVRKNRGGKTGRIDLKWEARSATFKNHDSLNNDFAMNAFDDTGLDLN